jgi:intein/homing endonuclease
MREFWNIETSISDTMESSGTYKLQPSIGTPENRGSPGKIEEIVDEFRESCYTDSGQKKVPPAIINAQDEAVEAFLDGYMAADGHVGERYDKRFHSVTTKHLPLGSGVAYLLQRLGFTFNIDTQYKNGGKEYYRLRCQKWHRDDPETLKQLE